MNPLSNITATTQQHALAMLQKPPEHSGNHLVMTTQITLAST